MDWDPIEDPVVNYFTIQNDPNTLKTIFESIHVDQSTKDPVFEMGSSAVGNAFVMD